MHVCAWVCVCACVLPSFKLIQFFQQRHGCLGIGMCSDPLLANDCQRATRAAGTHRRQQQRLLLCATAWHAQVNVWTQPKP